MIAIVPVVQTHPDRENPWGENERTPGLTPERLLTDFEIAFKGVEANFRDHWHGDPSKMSDEIIHKLPRIIMVSATLDILHISQAKFANRLQTQGVEVRWKTVDGLHQVKDMYQTRAGQEVADYVKQMTIQIVSEAQPPSLNRQGAMV